MAIGTIKFDDIGARDVTYASALTKGTDEGKPVKMSANDTVALAANGDAFFGIAQFIEAANANCAVREEGYVTVAYSGTAPVVGFDDLAADGAGGVKAVASGSGVLVHVVHVDTANTTVTFKLPRAA